MPKALVIAIIAVVVAAGGALAAFVALRGSEEALAAKTPADATFFGTVYLDPSASQKMNLRDLAARFPDLGSGQQLTDRVNAILDGAFASSGLTHDDVRPWLGSQIGFVARVTAGGGGAEFAVLVDTKDEGQARAALGKLRASDATVRYNDTTYGGVTVAIGSDQSSYAVTDGTVILSSDSKMTQDVIDTMQGNRPDLASSADYTDTVSRLPEGRLALLYVHTAPLFTELQGAGLASGAPGAAGAFAQLQAYRGLGITLSAEPTGLAFDLNLSVDPSKLTPDQRASLGKAPGPNSALAWTPSDAYGVLGVTDLKPQIQAALDQLSKTLPSASPGLDQLGLSNLVDHLTGDAAIEVGPGTGSVPSGVAAIGTDDEASMKGFLQGLSLALPLALEASSTSKSCFVTASPIGQEQTSQPKCHTSTRPGPTVSWKTLQYKGVMISYLPLPKGEGEFTPAYAVTGGFGLLGSSPEAIEHAIEAHASGDTISKAPTYVAALRDVPANPRQIFFVDLAATIGAIRDALPPDEQAGFDASVGRDLAPLQAFISASQSALDHTSARFVLLIR